MAAENTPVTKPPQPLGNVESTALHRLAAKEFSIGGTFFAGLPAHIFKGTIHGIEAQTARPASDRDYWRVVGDRPVHRRVRRPARRQSRSVRALRKNAPGSDRSVDARRVRRDFLLRRCLQTR